MVRLGSWSMRSSCIPFEEHSTFRPFLINVQIHGWGQSSEITTVVTINIDIKQVDKIFGAMLTISMFWIHAHYERSLQVLLLQVNKNTVPAINCFHFIIPSCSYTCLYHERPVCDFTVFTNRSLLTIVDRMVTLKPVNWSLILTSRECAGLYQSISCRFIPVERQNNVFRGRSANQWRNLGRNGGPDPTF